MKKKSIIIVIVLFLLNFFIIINVINSDTTNTGKNYYKSQIELNKLDPDINIIFPKNQSYYYNDGSVIVSNSTTVASMWFRNSTNGISWSNNKTMVFNGTFFTNSTILNWINDYHIIQVFANNSLGDITIKTQNFTIDDYGPYVVLENPKNKTYYQIDVDIILKNYSQVDKGWFRYYLGGWSANTSLAYNGSLFLNNSITWSEGINRLQVFANDSTAEIAMREVWFVVAVTFPLNLSANLVNDEHPCIATDSLGNVHLAWSGNETGSSEIYYDNNIGENFGNKIQITNDNNNYGVDIFVDSNNIVHLVWMHNFTSNTQIEYTNNTGGQFNAPVIIWAIDFMIPSLNYYPALAVDTTGIAHIVWYTVTESGSYEVFYTKIIGGSFTTRYNVSQNNANDFIKPDIVVDATGIAHIVYGNDITGNFQIYYKNNSLGDFSTNPINISRNNGFNDAPKIALDANEDVHITWMNDKTGDFEIYYINNIENEFTSSPLNVSNNSTFDDISPSISLDYLSVPNPAFISWSRNISGMFNIYESDNDQDSLTFRTPQLISKNPYCYYPKIAIDSNRNLLHYTFISNGSDFDVFYDYYCFSPFELISPKNFSYNINKIPVVVQNVSFVDKVWYRNDSGIGWSINYTLSWNGTHFINSSFLNWDEGSSQIQIFANNSLNEIYSRAIFFLVDSITPSGVQDPNTANPQKSGKIWVNGTASDSGVGIASIVVQSNNVTGGASFSANQENTTNWAFFNTSYIPDNNAGENYQIIINITDNVGNWNLTYCYIFCDNTPPSSSQDPTTTQPQKGTIIWVNGTSSDSGVGIASVVVQSNNVTGGASFSANQGNTTNWAFFNISYIPDNNAGVIFQISINITDNLGNWNITYCYIFCDNTPPSSSQDFITTQPQKGATIWVNGTAIDLGVGIASVVVQSNNVTGGASFSANQGDTTNWAFFNTSYIPDNNAGVIYQISINITDNLGNWNLTYCYIFCDNTPPSGTQDFITTQPQKGATIWVNGTASDLGVGIASVMVQSNNVTGGASWSVNQGTGTSWAFSNTSYIPDNNAGVIYQIILNITDNLGNWNITYCYIFCDNTPPSGSQDFITTQPQKGATIWVNGTAIDLGVGIASVMVQSNNVTGGASWSLNQGTGTSWAFFNTSYIPDNNAGVIYRISINITDNLGNWNLTYCYIFCDNAPPLGSQYLNTTQPQKGATIWINGTAIDLGVGIASVVVQGNNVTGGASFSANQGNTTNWAFFNTSYIPDNNAGVKYQISINITDNLGNWNLTYCYIFCDNTPPSGSQDFITTQPQKGATIWINGTAIDLGVGITSVMVESNNVTGGASWSVNQGTGTNWVFFNTSYIPDNNAGLIYQIIVNITDNLGNWNLTYCYIFIDNTPPTGSSGAYLSLPQNGTLVEIDLYFYLNGSAFDSGTGLLSVYIYPNEGNTSTSWSNNLNTNENWSFYNISSILDNNYSEVYEIKLNISDIVGNYLNLTFYFKVDTTSPSTIFVLADIGRPTDNFVELNWTASVDASRVRYEIWRKIGINGTWQLIDSTSYDILYYNDYNLENGIYEYKIRPIDESGNYGNFSDTIVVNINTNPPIPWTNNPSQENITWLILLIIGITIGIITLYLIYKRSVPKEETIPKYISSYFKKEPGDKQQIIPLFEALDVSKTKIKPQESIIEDIIPTPKLPEEEKIPVDRIGEIKETLYYLCPTCKKIYVTPKVGDYKCPQCQTQLNLQKRVQSLIKEDGKIITGEKDFIYFCSNCTKYFKTPIEGTFICPNCNIPLKKYNY